MAFYIPAALWRGILNVCPYSTLAGPWANGKCRNNAHSVRLAVYREQRLQNLHRLRMVFSKFTDVEATAKAATFPCNRTARIHRLQYTGLYQKRKSVTSISWQPTHRFSKLIKAGLIAITAAPAFATIFIKHQVANYWILTTALA